MTKCCRPRFELNIPPRQMLPVHIVQPCRKSSPICLTNVASATSSLETTPTTEGGEGGKMGVAATGDIRRCGPTTTSQRQEQQQWKQQQKHSWLSSNSSNFPSRILPCLFLGCHASANSTEVLEEIGIKRILNLCAEEYPTPSAIAETFNTMQVVLRDHSDEDIAAHFKQCLEFIREGIERDEPVLVHCRMGVSRSATIVLSYLMLYGYSSSSNPAPVSYDEAFLFVKALRPQVNPNFGFSLALRKLDTLNGFRTAAEDFCDLSHF